MGRKLVIVLALVLALGGVAAVGYQRAKSVKEHQVVPVIKPEVVRAAPLQMRLHTTTEAFYGRIVANAELNMSFQIVGRLWALGPEEEKILKENDMVEKGDVIARLEPARFKAALDQAKAMEDEARAEMAAADGAIKQAQAAAADAQKSYELQLGLKEKNVGRERELDAAKLALDTAKAQLDIINARHSKASAAYNAAKANFAVAEVNERDATLRSPITGRVAHVPHKIGMMIRPGESVMRIVDMRKVKLIIGVVERKLPQVREGLTVEVEVQALTAHAHATRGVDAKLAPRKGKITMVPPAANPVTGLFDIEIELDNKDDVLKPGMIAKAMIRLREDAKVIAVPVDAVRRRAGKLTAYFVSEGLPVGLDLGNLGKVEMIVPTPVVRQFDLGDAILEDDYYLVFDVPPGVKELIVEGQTRVADGSAVTVVREDLADANP